MLEYAFVGVTSIIATLLVMKFRAKSSGVPSNPVAEHNDCANSIIPVATEIIELPSPSPTLATEIIIGVSPEAGAVTLRAMIDEERFERARSISQPEPVLSRLNAIMQAVPGLLVAEQHAGRHLMEIVINGDLIRAADGNGFRAIAKGASGFTENARLFNPASLSNLVNAAAVWQVASVLVAQQHLADISARLKSIERGIERLSSFLDIERRSRLTGTYAYLGQLYSALHEGRLPMQAVAQLESAERDLLSIFDHLFSEFAQEAERTPLDGDTFGTEGLTKEAVAKVKRLESLASDLQLCLQVRTAAWYVLAVLPDVHGLQRARRKAIEDARTRLAQLDQTVISSARNDATRIKALWNTEETLQDRRQQVMAAAQKLKYTLQTDDATSALELRKMILALEHSSKPMKILLAVEDGRVVDTRAPI